MLIRYHEEFGPGGRCPQYPSIQVLCDSQGEPLIEREFTIPLDYHGYTFTTRADAVVEDLGYVKALEHKTSAPSWVASRLRYSLMDPQITGLIFALTTTFPDEKLWGCLVNVVVKGSSPRYGVAQRETVNRTPEDLEAWKVETTKTLRQIDESVELFRERRRDFGNWRDAAMPIFLESGRDTDQCHSYNRECEFLNLCRMKGLEDQFLGDFRAKTTAEHNTETETATEA